METPRETLDRALAYEPGQGVVLEFDDTKWRNAFSQALFSAKASDVRSSRAIDDPASPDWGTHRWQDVYISHVGDRKLFVGRKAEHKVGTKLMSLDEALKGG